MYCHHQLTSPPTGSSFSNHPFFLSPSLRVAPTARPAPPAPPAMAPRLAWRAPAPATALRVGGWAGCMGFMHGPVGHVGRVHRMRRLEGQQVGWVEDRGLRWRAGGVVLCARPSSFPAQLPSQPPTLIFLHTLLSATCVTYAQLPNPTPPSSLLYPSHTSHLPAILQSHIPASSLPSPPLPFPAPPLQATAPKARRPPSA